MDGAPKPCPNCSQVPESYPGHIFRQSTWHRILYDLSTGGCKIETARTPPLGASLTLRLAVSSETNPVEIDAAIVG
ncbi:MAG: PilZ domain-containing protein [Nitrospirales bacterium]|nr:PilZ domain-containing protein [Nitrospirales bacterium]